jgi:hypothetical protein
MNGHHLLWKYAWGGPARRRPPAAALRPHAATGLPGAVPGTARSSQVRLVKAAGGVWQVVETPAPAGPVTGHAR